MNTFTLTDTIAKRIVALGTDITPEEIFAIIGREFPQATDLELEVAGRCAVEEFRRQAAEHLREAEALKAFRRARLVKPDGEQAR